MIPERTKEYYDKEYEVNQRSPQDIAKEWGTYPNKIRRELIKYGFKLRNKSEAQVIALKSGRHKHPTKGERRLDDTKIKISETMAKKWNAMDDAERARRTALGKEQWDSMSQEEKMNFQEAALYAVREAAQGGSKLEKFLLDNLLERGYEVSFHSDDILPNTRLQTDLYIPRYRTVIEVDGPSHFFPIWGQENLEKNIEADNKKNSLLLTFGFVVIRVKHIAKTTSEIHKRKLLGELLRVLENIKSSFPKMSDRLIEIKIQ